MTEENSTIPQLQTVGRARQEVSLIVQTELEIAGVTEETFKALKEKALALSTFEIKSDADLATVQKLITEGTKLCTTISAAIEPGKKWAHGLHTAYVSNENEFIGTVEAIINPLKAKKAAYKEEQERLEREEMERQEAVIRERLVAIEGFGFARKTGVMGEEDYYVNAGGTVLKMSQITMSENAQWSNLIKGIEVAWGEERDRKEAEDKRVREEAEALAAREQKLADERADLDRRTKAINDAINTIRKNELLALGVSEDCYYNGIKQHFLGESVQAPFNEYTDTEWTLVVERVKEVVGRIKQKEEAAEEQVRLQEEAERVRTGELQELGAQPIEYPALPLHQYDADQWEHEVRCVRTIVEERRAEEHAQATIKDRTTQLLNHGWERTTSPEQLVLDLKTGSLPVRTVPFDIKLILDDEYFQDGIRDGRAELERRTQAEKDRIAAAAVEAERKRQEDEVKRAAAQEEERKAKLSEVERWDAWMVAIEENAPTLVSAQGQHAVKHLLAYIKDKYAPSVRNELKK